MQADFLKFSHDRFLANTCQFTVIHMFNAIKGNFPTALLQAISINTSVRKTPEFYRMDYKKIEVHHGIKLWLPKVITCITI
jgi:hypothetical protein